MRSTGDDGDAGDAIVAAAQRLRDRIGTLRIRLGVDATVPNSLSDEALARAGAVMATYRLVVWTPMGSADAHRALNAPGPADRVAVLDAIVDDLSAVAEFHERFRER